MKTVKQLYKQQDGMVAIMVTIVLMFVISLIVLGFNQNVRREQRQALDDHLSTQAFYAAESGINLARKNLANFISPAYQKNDCTETGHGIVSTDYEVADGVRITCLLINPVPDDLQYTLTPLYSEVGLLDTGGPVLDNLIINWQAGAGTGSGTSPDVSSGCNGTTNKTVAAWTAAGSGCSQPLLRIDLVRLDGTTANDWSNNQFTTFLYPSTTSATDSMSFASASSNGNRGTKVAVKCNGDLTTSPDKTSACKLTVTGLTGSKYGVRLMSVYRDAAVSLRATSGFSPLVLINGQAIIDSTAVAQDVSHRVQARVQLSGSQNSNVVPDFGIFSANGLCKQYTVTKTTWNPPGVPGYSPSTTVSTSAPDCKVDTNGSASGGIVSGW